MTGDLIGNKFANRITKVSKNSQQNSSETECYNNRISKNYEFVRQYTKSNN